MTQILQALIVGAGVLLPVLILMTIASIAAVRRGDGHAGEMVHDDAHAGAESEPVASRKLPFLPDREPSVLEILVLGAVLFAAVMGGLLGLSLLGQIS